MANVKNATQRKPKKDKFDFASATLDKDFDFSSIALDEEFTPNEINLPENPIMPFQETNGNPLGLSSVKKEKKNVLGDIRTVKPDALAQNQGEITQPDSELLNIFSPITERTAQTRKTMFGETPQRFTKKIKTVGQIPSFYPNAVLSTLTPEQIKALGIPMRNEQLPVIEQSADKANNILTDKERAKSNVLLARIQSENLTPSEAEESLKSYAQKVKESAIDPILKGAKTASEGMFRGEIQEPTQKKTDLGDRLINNVRDLAKVAGGSFHIAVNLLPPVALLNVVSPAIKEIAKDNYGEEGEKVAEKLTPFLFGTEVGIASLLSSGVANYVQESGILNGLKPKDQELAIGLLSDAAFLLTHKGIGKLAEKTGISPKKLGQFISEKYYKPITKEYLQKGKLTKEGEGFFHTILTSKETTEAEKKFAVNFLEKMDINPEELIKKHLKSETKEPGSKASENKLTKEGEELFYNILTSKDAIESEKRDTRNLLRKMGIDPEELINRKQQVQTEPKRTASTKKASKTQSEGNNNTGEGN